MGKIRIIIVREYLNRVKNRTFIIMSIVTPLLFGAMILLPTFLSTLPSDPRSIVIVDEVAAGCGQIFNYEKMFRDTLNLNFDTRFAEKPYNEVRKLFADSQQTSIVVIPKSYMGACDSTGGVSYYVTLFSKNEPGQQTINYVGKIFSEAYRQYVFSTDSTLTKDKIEKMKMQIAVKSNVKGAVSKSEVKSVTGIVLSIIIYFYILFFGVQVMKSVLEEKNTRIVEIIISSVKPFQLMIGKIIATAMAGLTQFLVWAVLSFFIITPIINKVNDKRTDVTQAQLNPTAIAPGIGSNSGMPIEVNETLEGTVDTIQSIQWGLILGSFVFYFVFGYLMYASLYAAVGAASDTETDTQQFSLPLTIPLVIAISSFGIALNNPNGVAMKWLSMIPFTSPVTMLMRLPYNGVSLSELLLSMLILVVSFVLMTMLAARIYRVGILMYGKKASWRELGKWLFWRG
ncbi:MAG: ABC transporter permease [Bacteroidia bacterium]|jgi:ABC-2 type transport system permease protein|nr:ABC transporter permease [Bacteroidia bacterium]